MLAEFVKSSQKKSSQNTQHYLENVKILAKKVEKYKGNPEKQQALSKSIYRANTNKFKANTIELLLTNSRLFLKKNYRANAGTFKALSLKYYRANTDKFKALSQKKTIELIEGNSKLSECKVPTKLEVDGILALKEAFQKSIKHFPHMS